MIIGDEVIELDDTEVWLYLTWTAGYKSDCKSPLKCLGNDWSSYLCDMKIYATETFWLFSVLELKTT